MISTSRVSDAPGRASLMRPLLARAIRSCSRRAAGSPRRGDHTTHVRQAKTIKREKLAFDDPEALQALCGSNNSRLKLVERTAGAQVNLRGNEITIEGDDTSA